MILRDQAVVEVVVLDLQEDGLTIYVVAGLQEVDHFGGDEDAVAVDGLHGNEAGEGKRERQGVNARWEGKAVWVSNTHTQTCGKHEGHSQLRVDVVGEVEELLLAVSLSGRVSRQ